MMQNRQNKQAFDEVIKQYSPEIQALVLKVRALIITIMPSVCEVVWIKQRTMGYGTGPKKMSEHFCWIAPTKQHVDIGFNYGSELPDPAHLLEGTGKLFRHVKIHSDEDLKNPALRDLITTATKHRVPPISQDI